MTSSPISIPNYDKFSIMCLSPTTLHLFLSSDSKLISPSTDPPIIMVIEDPQLLDYNHLSHTYDTNLKKIFIDSNNSSEIKLYFQIFFDSIDCFISLVPFHSTFDHQLIYDNFKKKISNVVIEDFFKLIINYISCRLIKTKFAVIKKSFFNVNNDFTNWNIFNDAINNFKLINTPSNEIKFSDIFNNNYLLQHLLLNALFGINIPSLYHFMVAFKIHSDLFNNNIPLEYFMKKIFLSNKIDNISNIVGNFILGNEISGLITNFDSPINEIIDNKENFFQACVIGNIQVNEKVETSTVSLTGGSNIKIDEKIIIKNVFDKYSTLINKNKNHYFTGGNNLINFSIDKFKDNKYVIYGKKDNNVFVNNLLWSYVDTLTNNHDEIIIKLKVLEKSEIKIKKIKDLSFNMKEKHWKITDKILNFFDVLYTYALGLILEYDDEFKELGDYADNIDVNVYDGTIYIKYKGVIIYKIDNEKITNICKNEKGDLNKINILLNIVNNEEYIDTKKPSDMFDK